MFERFDDHGRRVTIGERTFLKKAIVISLLYLTALPAFADDGRIEIASVDRDLYRHQERVVLAPAVREKHVFYEIKGSGAKELRDQMTRQGIAWSDGEKYDSITSWHVTWDYERERSLQSCSAEAFQATAEITIRYPKWVRTDAAPQELADKWDAYLASLIEHEEGHRDMVVEAVNDLTRAVAQLPAAPTCAELDRRVRSLSHERMAKLNDDAKEYDAATLHGAEQGAVFP
jgi:predicted secreted Zn-dependent protease